MQNFDSVFTGQKPFTLPPTDIARCIDESLVCCTQARSAARCGRLAAAQGLLQTALLLLGRVGRDRTDTLWQSSTDVALAERRLDSLMNEICFCAQTIEVETVKRESDLSTTVMAFSTGEEV